ncbi:MAG: Gfo/Idh/MocA family oxidoreductase [Chloroflexi bacterium]|nr:Gfo/Idh/MocA family oxidoreductase [Chloroflexota bacterium]MCL5273734.1 Gfo/Idh/MocA family oxidoreductase [Chloroflexota bacterium]
MSKLKVAVVGTGKVAENNYLPCLAVEPDVALGYYNRTRAKADACAARFGGEVFGSLQELADWNPATILVLTRETDRFDVANALLDQQPGRLFFEKPLVARLGQEHVSEQDFVDGRQIIQRADAQGSQTAMVFNYRFFEHSQLARRIVSERQFGKVLNVTGLVHYACWSHCIDLVHFFAGPIAQISALQGATEHGMSFLRARDVTAAFRTQDDATGTLVGTTTLAWDFPLFELTFNFEGGRIRMQDLDGDLEVMDNKRMDIERYRIYGARSRWDQYNSSFVKSVQAYLESIRHGEPPPVPGRFGLLELQVEAGLKRSIAQGRPITLAEEFPLS